MLENSKMDSGCTTRPPSTKETAAEIMYARETSAPKRNPNASTKKAQKRTTKAVGNPLDVSTPPALRTTRQQHRAHRQSCTPHRPTLLGGVGDLALPGWEG